MSTQDKCPALINQATEATPFFTFKSYLCSLLCGNYLWLAITKTRNSNNLRKDLFLLMLSAGRVFTVPWPHTYRQSIRQCRGDIYFLTCWEADRKMQKPGARYDFQRPKLGDQFPPQVFTSSSVRFTPGFYFRFLWMDCFEISGNGIVSLLSFSVCLPLMCQKATNICMLILYSATLLNVFISSEKFLVGSLGFCIWFYTYICKQGTSTSFPISSYCSS